MKHVYVLVPSLRMGGAEIQALRNCEALLGAGYEVTLVTIFRVDEDFFAPYLGALQQRGLKARALIDRPVPLTARGTAHFLGVLAQASRRLAALYDADRPDVIYTRLWFASLLAWITKARAHHRPRLIFNEESRLQPASSGLKAWARLFLLRRAGTWLVPCQGLFDEALALGSPGESGEVLPNIVAAPAPMAPKALHPGPIVLGFLGRLEAAKGLDRLLDVASGLLAAKLDFRLEVAGGGSLEGMMLAQMVARGLTGHVKLLGPISDVTEFFGRIDLLLLTSHYEGFANVIVEANAHGVAALAMRVPHGPEDIIREGVNGFLVANGDVNAMVAFLAKLTPQTLVGMQEACRAIADEAYSVRSQQQRWRQLLEPALAVGARS